MIIYQVNLIIEPAIYAAYMSWLKQHISEMLALPGFIDANLLIHEPLDIEPSVQQRVTVKYSLENRQQLQNYFDQHAAAQREAGFARFGQQFSATRQILQVID